MQSNWDTIVIGAGIGGLTAAAYLAVCGGRTLLLEKHTTVGGCTQAFHRERAWRFEVGTHYLGECGPDGLIPTVLRGVGLADRVELEPFAQNGFDTILYPGFEMKVPVGWDAYRANLLAAFPSDARGITRFLSIVRPIGEAIHRPRVLDSRFGLWRMIAAGPAARWALAPLASLLDACALSPEARAVLSTQWVSYSCPPSRAPVALHAGFLHQYVGCGAHYPKGGGHAMASRLASVILAHDGVIRTGAGVRRILVEAGRAVGVELESGERLSAPSIVSNADLVKTYLELVGREHLPKRVVEWISRAKLAPAFINTYFGVNVDLRTRMPATNFFSMPSWDDPDRVERELVSDVADCDPDAWLEAAEQRLGALIHSATAVDRHVSHAPEGCSVIESMANLPGGRELFSFHEGSDTAPSTYRKKGRYREVKERLVEIMLARIERALPGLSGHVVWKEASTSLTHARYTGSAGGTAYGIEPNAAQLLARPRSRSALRGLYLAGTSTVWGPAIRGSMQSGVMAAGAVLGRDLFGEILSQRRVLSRTNDLSALDPSIGVAE